MQNTLIGEIQKWVQYDFALYFAYYLLKKNRIKNFIYLQIYYKKDAVFN